MCVRAGVCAPGHRIVVGPLTLYETMEFATFPRGGTTMIPTGRQEPAAINKGPERKFSEMTGGGKLIHIGKVIVFIISFGFVFPTIFSD